jgi:glycosyltransferase involved in cell wall biosynthesis
MSPGVSVISICYRNPEELEATLQSLRGLDPALCEVIVVDGSPDESCARVAARHPAFRYLHGPDRGKYDAMNKGIAAAAGDSLLFMNSGDRPNDAAALEALVRAHRGALATTLVYGDCIFLVGGERLKVPAPPPTPENLRLGRLPSHQSILIPRAFHQRHLYDARFHFAADTKFLKAALRELPHLYVPQVIGVYAYGGVSTSPGSLRSLRRQYREICDAHELRAWERIALASTIVRRKLLHAFVGEDELQRLQAERLRRVAQCEPLSDAPSK